MYIVEIAYRKGKTVIKYFLLTGFILIFIAAADTGSARIYPDGRTISLISNEDICMVSESVFITPTGNRIPEAENTEMEVECVFFLENLTDENKHVTACFPFEPLYGEYGIYGIFSFNGRPYSPYNSDSLYSIGNFTDLIESGISPDSLVPENLRFQCYVNGQVVDVRFLFGTVIPEENLICFPLFAVWDMYFDPHQTLKVENSYYTDWNRYEARSTTTYSFRYVVKSGATWSGFIDHAVISITVPQELPESCSGDSLQVEWEVTGNPLIDGRTFTWEFEDWEPDDDLEICIHKENLNWADGE